MITVKLIELGRETREYSFENSATLGDLMAQAEEEFIPGNVTVNQSVVNESTLLRDGDNVFLGNKVKGNLPFEVQLIRLGSGSNINLPAEDGYTIDRVLAQLSEDNKAQFFGSDNKALYEYRVGGAGQPVSGSHVLSRPASGSVRLILSTRTKGN